MKVVSLQVLFALRVLCLVARAGAHVLPKECCNRYARKTVQHVKSFYKTSQGCTLPAVVLVAANGDKVCANPKKHWVKKAIEKLQRKK
ncbi:C-C motif chemokine 5-like isoform X4 [Lathamus discolor]|uniref:C-C motif chemokine 5-like isoform X4 n=1 Tax=Lathamus discolor TaxID=678569 RepID=UPI0032B7FD3B